MNKLAADAVIKKRIVATVTLVSTATLAGCAPANELDHSQSSPGARGAAATHTKASTSSAAWGLYANLAGQSRWSDRAGGTRISWHWLEPGQVLQETWTLTEQNTVSDTYLLQLGDKPGQIRSRASGMLEFAWTGQIQPDGSVLFTGENPHSQSFSARLAADDAFELRQARISADGALHLSPVLPEDRYTSPPDQHLPFKTEQSSAPPQAGRHQGWLLSARP